MIRANIKALKFIYKLRKRFIPSIILSKLFSSFSPYLTIYMSAEIVNELAGARDSQRLLSLVLFTITANLLIMITGRFCTKFKDYEWQSFQDAENRIFTEFGFTMDYEHLENPEIRQSRRKIDENKCINSFGIWAVVYMIENMTGVIIEIILAVCFTSSLFVLTFNQASDMSGAVLYPTVILALVALSIFFSMKNSKKLSILGDEISNANLEHNRIDDGFWHMYKSGQDIRIYNMAIIFRKHCERMQQLQVSGNRKYWFGYRNTEIPNKIISQGINFSIYAFVCLNALRGLFEIGSVIKYVGFRNSQKIS